jgi:hypothetical protein
MNNKKDSYVIVDTKLKKIISKEYTYENRWKCFDKADAMDLKEKACIYKAMTPAHAKIYIKN